MMSKVIVLGLITAIQAVIIAFIDHGPRPAGQGPDPVEQFAVPRMTFTLIRARFTSMMVGPC